MGGGRGQVALIIWGENEQNEIPYQDVLPGLTALHTGFFSALIAPQLTSLCEQVHLL